MYVCARACAYKCVSARARARVCVCVCVCVCARARARQRLLSGFGFMVNLLS